MDKSSSSSVIIDVTTVGLIIQMLAAMITDPAMVFPQFPPPMPQPRAAIPRRPPFLAPAATTGSFSLPPLYSMFEKSAAIPSTPVRPDDQPIEAQQPGGSSAVEGQPPWANRCGGRAESKARPVTPVASAPAQTHPTQPSHPPSNRPSRAAAQDDGEENISLAGSVCSAASDGEREHEDHDDVEEDQYQDQQQQNSHGRTWDDTWYHGYGDGSGGDGDCKSKTGKRRRCDRC